MTELRWRRRTRGTLLGVTAAAWAVMVLTGDGHRPVGGSGGAGGMRMYGPAGLVMPHQSSVAASAPVFPRMWPLMLLAMMTPLLFAGLRHVYVLSLASRRVRGMVLLVAGYATVWLGGGFVVQAVATVLRLRAGPGNAALVGLLIAVLWSASPMRQRCVNRRHAFAPVVAFGRPADLGAWQAGCTQAFWCFGSCWALMLLPMLVAATSMVVMAGVTLWVWAEAYETPVRPAWRMRVPMRAVRVIGATLQPRLSRGVSPGERALPR